jgi:hypothetical protein
MYADSTINDDVDDDDLIDPEINPNRPLINYSFDHDEDISPSTMIRPVVL